MKTEKIIPGNDETKRAEITSRVPSETDLQLLVIDPPDEWVYED